MNRQFLLIDGNSLGRACQAAKVLKIGSMEVQAIFGFLRGLNSYVRKYAFATPVVLWDGLSWRNTLYPEYKENRKKTETKNDLIQQHARKSYQAQRPHIQKALSFLGVAQVSAQNMEADDLAAIMANLYNKQGFKVTLLTEDQDWLQLVKDGVAVERIVSKDRITVSNFKDVTGIDTPAKFVEMKALMGDQGDNIKGIGGIGSKRAVEFLETYGSFSNFMNMVLLEKTVDYKTLPKYLRDLIEDEHKALDFQFNISLVDLNSSVRPAPVGWHINKGEPSAENFRKMCELLLFKSITDQFDTWISAFSALAPAPAE